MKRIFTVLRSGGEYNESHVRWLKEQCDDYARRIDFICLTDLLEIKGVETHPLIHHWEGWWSKIELFRYENVFYLDLDTVLTGDISDMMEDTEGFYALRNFGNFRHKGSIVMGSGVMAWSESYRHIYDSFDPAITRKYRTHQKSWGDQGYIYDCIDGQYIALQDTYPGRIHSYKKSGIDQDNPPESIICFHGKPRPWDSDQDWVPPFVP